MIDALLFSVQDAVRNAGYGYGEAQCQVMPDGQPPPRCGELFIAVHQGSSNNSVMNNLDEYFAWSITLTQRMMVPWDRVGDQVLAKRLPRKATQNYARTYGFNARCEQLRAFLHMNWTVLQDANNFLVNMEPDAFQVYGFCEPAHFAGMDIPDFVYGDWFSADPGAKDVGLKSELRFVDCRRLQAMETYV